MERNATNVMEYIHTLYLEAKCLLPLAKAVPLHMESNGLERHHTRNKIPHVWQLGHILIH